MEFVARMENILCSNYKNTTKGILPWFAAAVSKYISMTRQFSFPVNVLRLSNLPHAQ
jgi:hypothetical protein